MELEFDEFELTGAVPAEIGRLSALRVLDLSYNQLTSLPMEIWQLTSLERLDLDGNQLTSLPAEIGQLTSLTYLNLSDNRLTSLPAEIGQLTSLKSLSLYNILHLGLWTDSPSLPAEIGQLTSLRELWLNDNQLWPDGMASPAAIRELRAAGCDVRSLDIRSDEDWD